MRLYLRSDDAVPNRLRITAGRDLPRRLPNVAGRRPLERRGGANASLAGLHAAPSNLLSSVLRRPLRGCVRAAPLPNAVEVAKSQTLLPSQERLDTMGAATNMQVRWLRLCMSILMTPHCTFAQARTVVPAPRGTSRKASSAHPATKTRGTSCTNSRALLCSHAHSGILCFPPGWASCLSLSRCSWSAFSFALPTRCLLYSI